MKKVVILTELEGVKYYKSENGEYFACIGSYGESLFYSPDGISFFELKVAGFSGSSEEYRLSFNNPHHDYEGKIDFTDNEIKWEGKIFYKTIPPTEITQIPLPTVRISEYLFRSEDGRLFYVSADKYNYSYGSFRLFVGTEGNMSEVKIESVTRYRDGGTTYIETGDGTLFSPTPFEKEKTPTWEDITLEALNPKEYQITETQNGVNISRI